MTIGKFLTKPTGRVLHAVLTGYSIFYYLYYIGTDISQLIIDEFRCRKRGSLKVVSDITDRALLPRTNTYHVYIRHGNLCTYFYMK